MFSLSNLCFLCLNSSNNLKPVLIENNEGIFVQKQLKYCLPEMDTDFLMEVPKYICSNCISNLESLYKFKQTCLQNNTYLKNYMQTLKSTYGSNKQLSEKINDIKCQNKLQAVSSDGTLPIIKDNGLRTGENKDTGAVSKHDIMFVDVLDIEGSHSYIKEENEVFVKEEFVTSEDNIDDQYVKTIKCETITSDSDLSVSRIDDIQANSKYSNCSSESNSTKPKKDSISIFMNQGRYADNNAPTVSSPWDRCSPMNGKWKSTQDAEGFVEESISTKNQISMITSPVNISGDGEGKTLTSVWQDKETSFNTSVRSTTGESSSTMCEIEEINDISEDILMGTRKATEVLIPTKSKAIYDKEFQIFVNWKMRNGITIVNETVMLKYFQELSEKYTPNSLCTKYSILKSALFVHDNVDISPFNRLMPILKKKLKGYIPKKSKVLTGDQVLMFMKNAPNEKHLLHKVALIIGMSAACRKYELVNMRVQDVQDQDNLIIINIPDPKTNKPRTSRITEPTWINLIKKYVSLRPKGVELSRFFIFYSENKCKRQPVGINSFGRMPSKIAKYLKLENPEEYTGDCFRRSSATVLAGYGAETTLWLEKYYNS